MSCVTRFVYTALDIIPYVFNMYCTTWLWCCTLSIYHQVLHNHRQYCVVAQDFKVFVAFCRVVKDSTFPPGTTCIATSGLSAVNTSCTQQWGTSTCGEAPPEAVTTYMAFPYDVHETSTYWNTRDSLFQNQHVAHTCTTFIFCVPLPALSWEFC